MENYSEGDPLLEGEEVEGEEFEGEYVEQQEAARPVVAPVVRELPPENDSKKKVKGKRKKPPPPIRINLSCCKYEVLRIVQRKLGWKEVGDDEEWEIYWTDTSVSIERIMKLTRIQKINHFSGMLEICRKRAMARNLMKMARMFPQHYDFFPRTFILPGDKEEFMADIRARGKKQVYILKPDAGCQGRGIRLVQGGKDEVVARVLSEMATPNVVAQHYLTSPLLIHGYKFDLRIYALVLSCDPMRVFLFHEGLARICTEKYSPPKASNLDVAFMHLTNYAVNKKNEAFVAASAAGADSGEDASKWCLAQLRQYITSMGHDYNKVWADIGDLIIKSLCSVQPILRNNYRSVLPPDNDGFSCFEILGYDVMLDDALRPWLIEVNHSPSFNIDSPLDLAIKEELITQTIELVRVDPKLIAKTKKAEKRAATSRLLEPMHAKKAAAGRQGAGAASGSGGTSTSGAQAESRDKDRERTAPGDAEEGGGAGGAGAGAGGAAAAGLFKPRTPEEYEAWRAKVLAARERYEAKHMGNFTRIFPSPDPAKQALYEELLKGAGEIYQASFQARSKRLEAAEEKKRKEDAETDAQRAERLKARAHRDKLAQMAVERRKFKLLQQQALQGGQLLPAYLLPPPQAAAQPYLPGAGGSAAAQHQQQMQQMQQQLAQMALQQMQGQAQGQAQGQWQGQSQGQGPQPVYYMPLMPMGPYQYDPAVYHQYYYQQASYLYGGGGGAGGGGPPARLSEVYGERSDGAPSVASSRPASALSSGSHVTVDATVPTQGSQGTDSRGAPRVQVGPVARTVASASSAQRAASPAAAGGGSGVGSPMGLSGAGSGGGSLHGGQAMTLQQQVLLQHGHAVAYQQQQLQQQQQPHVAHLSQQSSFQQTQQTQGALPPNPFLGGGSRRPSSATSRASTGAGYTAAAGAGTAPAGGDGHGHGHSADWVATLPGRGHPHPAPVAPALPPGATPAGSLSGGRLNSGGAAAAAAGSSFGYGHATPIHQLQLQQQAAAAAATAAAAAAAQPPPPPVRPVSVGSAHNHVRHAHVSGATEAAGAAFAAGDGPESPDLWKSERDQRQPGPALGAGAGQGPGKGPGRGLLLSGSRPPSASAVPASIRDKLQPNAGAGVGPSGPAGGPGGGSAPGGSHSAPGLSRKPSMSSVLANGAAIAAATWDAAMAAASAAAAQDTDSLTQYLGTRQRPRSATQGLRPTSGATGVSQRSPSPSRSPSSVAAMASALAALATAGGGGSGRNSAERATTPDSYLLGLAHVLGQAPPSPSPQQHQPLRQPSSSPQLTAAANGPGSPGKVVRMGSGDQTVRPVTPSGAVVTASVRETGSSMSGGVPPGRAYKQQCRSPASAVLSGLSSSPQAHAVARLRVEDESVGNTLSGYEDAAPLVYQPLVMPDAASPSSSLERKGTTVPVRHWSATSATAGAPSGSARQRSLNTGATGVSSSSGTAASSVVGSRPPVYPPHGGGPGSRAAGAPSSGRAGAAAGGGSSGSISAKVNGGASATVRLNSGGFGAAFSASGAVPHPALGGAGSMLARTAGGGSSGGGSSGSSSGAVVGLVGAQEGLEALQITATSVEMSSQLRNAALAALNRRGLAVKGRKVAQQ